MAYFNWGKDLVIDNGLIDADHIRLVGLINDLHTATSQGMGQSVVAQILGDVVRYTNEHLQREEQLMESVRFPGIAGHKQVHAKFMADMYALQQKYNEGSITVASQLSTKLRDWLSLHIRRSDRELRPYVLKK